jgi:glyoxylase I family protein
MQPESSDGFASVGTILPKGRAALLPGGSFRIQTDFVLCPNFIDHLVFRVPDPLRVERFYTSLLGPPLEAGPASVVYRIGPTRIFFTKMSPDTDSNYDKEKTGLNHLAFGLKTLADLEQMRDQLDRTGIRHSGIGRDRYGHRDYMWMDDPAGMRVELYVRGSDE